jgi:predicted nuclease of predicted toxin-antitoxin system
VKLLLDEHFSPTIAAQLQKQGYDVISVAERGSAEHAPLRQQSDEDLLRWARSEGRVLVTENIRDFMPIHQAFLACGDHHAGILFTSPRKFPRRTGTIGTLITALALFLDRHPIHTLATDIAWL